MATNVAKVHTHQSKRVKRGNLGDPNRKVVFKSVLENPFRVQWPPVPENVQNALLAAVLPLLDGVAEYHVNRPSKSRKRKREERESDAASKKSASNATLGNVQLMNIDQTMTANDVKPPTPAILEHITMGINQVTKELEYQVKAARSGTPAAVDEQSSKPVKKIKLVLVCRADVDPPILIDHIPHLVAAYNSNIQPKASVDLDRESSEVVKLGILPKGSELLLAEAVGLRRVSILAINNNQETISKFHSLLDGLPVLSASWLSSPELHIPTHIKQLKTTAPKDIKKAKEQRLQGRVEAKKRKKTTEGA
jgi:ribonuclease P/MRP protein subunit POP3